MKKIIVAEFIDDPLKTYKGSGIPMVILSNHPEYKPGTRLDWGSLAVALAQGFSVLIESTGRPMTDIEKEIWGEGKVEEIKSASTS